MESSKRLVNLTYAGTTIVAWLVFSKLLLSIFTTMGVRNPHLLGKGFTLVDLIGAALSIGMLVWAWRHVRYRPLAEECADELTKVTWPTWDETKNNTRVTVVVTIIIAFILWIFDVVFFRLTDLILGGPT